MLTINIDKASVKSHFSELAHIFSTSFLIYIALAIVFSLLEVAIGENLVTAFVEQHLDLEPLISTICFLRLMKYKHK